MTLDFRLEQPVDASVDVVWQACASARGLARWQADAVTGDVAREGRLELAWPALGTSLLIRVTELVERERIVLDSGGSRVRLFLSPGRVVLEHEGLDPDDDVEGVASSWRLSLALLAHSVEKRPGLDRRAVWMLDKARTTPEAAHAFFSDSAALGTWLASGSGIGRTGSAVALQCTWGEPISGRVLANTPGRDIAISWTEDDESVLCLRTLPSPRTLDERLILFYWSRWSHAEPPAERRRGLGAALEHLARALGRSAEA